MGNPKFEIRNPKDLARGALFFDSGFVRSSHAPSAILLFRISDFGFRIFYEETHP